MASQEEKRIPISALLHAGIDYATIMEKEGVSRRTIFNVKKREAEAKEGEDGLKCKPGSGTYTPKCDDAFIDDLIA